MFDLQALASTQLLGNSLLRWTIAIAITFGAFTLFGSLRRIVRRYHRSYAATDHQELLEIPLYALSRTALLFFALLSIYLGAQALILGERPARILRTTIAIALFWQTGVWAVAAVTSWLERKRRRTMTVDRAMAGSLGVIGFLLNVLIWSLVVLLTLDNLGVNITALVAGLGIGGIAVALAVQNILGDLFASLSITLDRPFVVGDFLSVGDVLGSVEYIGIKSTRLRSLGGEQIIMPNADLLGSRVRNYGRMTERRVVFATNLAYQTPLDTVERVPALIRRIVESQADTRFDRSHFARHGVNGLEFETVYFVLTADYTRYMDIQQAINLQLQRELHDLGVEFAYPTQKLFLARARKHNGVNGQTRRVLPERSAPAESREHGGR